MKLKPWYVLVAIGGLLVVGEKLWQFNDLPELGFDVKIVVLLPYVLAGAVVGYFFPEI